MLAPSALTPWMDSAYFERALFSLGNRVDVSVRARLFSGGTRRAIELRDRICTHPYCYEPAERCEGDHIETGPRGSDHPGERAAALWVPQPPAQPARTPAPAPAAPADGGLRGRRAPRNHPSVDLARRRGNPESAGASLCGAHGCAHLHTTKPDSAKFIRT